MIHPTFGLILGPVVRGKCVFKVYYVLRVFLNKFRNLGGFNSNKKLFNVKNENPHIYNFKVYGDEKFEKNFFFSMFR
jgi:hypothetical protein